MAAHRDILKRQPKKLGRAALTKEQYYVARRKGTERAFSSELCSLLEAGRYHCIWCDTPLFDSTSKFESRTGWPSFTTPLTPDVVQSLLRAILNVKSHGIANRAR